MSSRSGWTVEEGWTTYDEFSALWSASIRNLALGGIAVVWALRDSTASQNLVAWSPWFILCLLFFGTSLLLDMLQYAYYTIFWYRTTRRHEIEIHKKEEGGKRVDHEFTVTEPSHAIGDLLMYGKFALVSIGYVLMLVEVAAQFYAALTHNP